MYSLYVVCVQIISAEVICIVQLMAILMAVDISDEAMDYTLVTLIGLFLFIWIIFYLFNVTWRDDDDDLIESHVRRVYNIINVTSLHHQYYITTSSLPHITLLHQYIIIT